MIRIEDSLSRIFEDPGTDYRQDIKQILHMMLAELRLLQSQKEPQASETPSSAATETLVETNRISSISFSSWCRVNLDGTLTLFPSQAMWDLVNSQLRRGQGQEVEIGVTLTSKAATLQSGSVSPSTAEPTPRGNGLVGDFLSEPTMRQPDRIGVPAPEPSTAPSSEAREEPRCGNYSKVELSVCDMPLDHFRKTGESHSGIGSIGRVFWGAGSINFPSPPSSVSQE